MADEVSKDISLTKTIEDAATKVAKSTLEMTVTEDAPKEDKETKEVKSEVKSETKTEEAPKDELTPEQAKMAQTLFKALNNSDPNVQKQTLKILVEAAGLNLKEIETKKDVEEAKEATLLELLKEGLGEYDFLAEKLGPVLEKAFNKIVDTKTKDIREDQAKFAQEKLESQINTAIDTAFGKFENSTELGEEVKSLMDDYPHNGKISREKYFEDLIKLAAVNKGVTLKLVGSKDTTKIDETKAAKNRLDAASRLASERGAEVKTGVRTSQHLSLKEAVEQAAEEALKQLNK